MLADIRKNGDIMADAASQNEEMEHLMAEPHFLSNGVKDNAHCVAYAANGQPDYAGNGQRTRERSQDQQRKPAHNDVE